MTLLKRLVRMGSGVVIAVALPLGALLGVPLSAASASVVTIGDSSTAPLSNASAGGVSLVQASTAVGTQSYSPSETSDLTSFSTYAGPSSGEQVSFEIWRRTGTANWYYLEYISPAQTLTPNQVNTYTLPARFAVIPGDMIGLYLYNGYSPYIANGTSGDVVMTLDTASAPTALNTYSVFAPLNDPMRLNLSATLSVREPAPPTPTWGTATQVGLTSSVALTWNDNNTAGLTITDHQVRVYTVGKATKQLPDGHKLLRTISTGSADQTYTVTGLNLSKDYAFTVCSDNGRLSAYSAYSSTVAMARR